MSSPLLQSDASLQVMRALGIVTDTLGDPDGVPTSPGEVVAWLARLRVLHGVPFGYLAVHDEMLPPESIRFFYLDRNWTDAAVDGALSVAAITARDREQLAGALPAVRRDVDAAERRVRSVEDAATVRAGDGVVSDQAGRLAGFVLRSQAVSGWPGMEVHAEVDGDRLRFLRLERLAPGVLLAIIDGVPDRVELTEPRTGMQFGVDRTDDNGVKIPLRSPATGAQLPLRDALGVVRPNTDPTFPTSVPASMRHTSGSATGTDLRVPLRSGGHGTVHVTELVRRLHGITDHTGRPLVIPHAIPSGPAADDLAVQLLQFPYRQPFAGDGERPDDDRPGHGRFERFEGFARDDLTVHLDRVLLDP